MDRPATTGLALLDGVRVVDFSQALSGPYCTLMLADLGADVIKVENPNRGDDARHWGPPFVGNDAAYFMAVNRNKRSVALDLKDPEGAATARDLASTADVVVENWRPGTAARLGLGADRLRALSPGLIHCSISGYGQDRGTLAGYDQILQGTSGAMHLTGAHGEPTKWGVPVGDVASGMFAANAIVAALYARTVSGLGRSIDIAMQDSLVSMLTHHAARYLATGVVPPSDHNGHATITPYGLFKVADGFVNVCVGNDSQYRRLCGAVGRQDLGQDPRFLTNPLRNQHKAALLAELDAILGSRTVAEVVGALGEVGVPVGPVLGMGEVLDGPVSRDRSMVLSFERNDCGTARVVNTPWKFDGVAPDVRLAPPRLGEHTDQVLGLLGADGETAPCASR